MSSCLYERHAQEQKSQLFYSAAGALIPPNEEEPDIWAENSLELSAKVTRFPGKIRFDLTPYARAPLRSFKHNRRTVCVFGAQVGKTLILQSCMGYTIDQDPGPMMIVYPEQGTAKRRSRKHLQPLIKDSRTLSKHLTEKKDDIQLFEFALDRMTINMAWSGSAAVLASEPIRYLLRDEFAKFSGATDKEADAMSLSERRTISFSWLARIFDCTTPTLEHAAGWMDLIGGTYNCFHVPCPHCGKMQVLIFTQFKYPGRENEEPFTLYKNRVVENTYYECIHCKGEIRDIDKPEMLKKGEWEKENPEAGYESFHLPSWYAPWVRFGDVAGRFIEAKNDPEKLQDWINSDCAEPWKEFGENADFNIVLKHKLDYEIGDISTNDPVIVVLTVDVQKDRLWYVVRAHGLHKSYNLEYGTLANLPDVIDMLNNRIYYQNGDKERPNPIAIGFVDSGYRTTEVYSLVNSDHRLFALKGEETQKLPIMWTLLETYPGTNKKMPKSIKLCNVHTTHFKEELLLRLAAGIEEDGTFNEDTADWFLHKDTKDSYARQITAETVIEDKDNRGFVKRIWKRIREDNHLFDCEVYQLGARWLLKNDLTKLYTPKQKHSGPKITTQKI